MGSKQAENVVKVLHSFLGEMNQIIKTAEVMRNDILKYRSFLKKNLDLPVELFCDEGGEMNLNYVAPAAKYTASDHQHNALGLQVSIPSNMEQELHEIQSTMESNAELQEQLEPAATMADEEIKKIAAQMLPVRRHDSRLSDVSATSVTKPRPLTGRRFSLRGSRKASTKGTINASRKGTINASRKEKAEDKKEAKKEKDAPHIPVSMLVRLKMLANQKKQQRNYRDLVESESEDSRRQLRSPSNSKVHPVESDEQEEERDLDHVPMRVFATMKLAARRWKQKAEETRQQREIDECQPVLTEFPTLPIMTMLKLKRLARNAIQNREEVENNLKMEEEISIRKKPLITRNNEVQDEEQAKEIIARNTRYYNLKRRESIRKGVQKIMEEVPPEHNLPSIKSFVKQSTAQITDDSIRIQDSVATSSSDLSIEKKKKHTLISCESNFVWLWEIMIFSLSIYIALTVPLSISMNGVRGKAMATFSKVNRVLSPIIDTIYVLDIWLKTRMTYHNYVREEIWNYKLIKRKYFRSSIFKLDLIAAVPWCCLVAFVTLFRTPLGILAFARVLKIMAESYWQKLKTTLSKSTHQNPAILRMLGMILLFSLVAHNFGCMYAYNRNKNYFRGNWKLTTLEFAQRSKVTLGTHYFEALYFSLCVIAGNDRVPIGLRENMFGCLGLLISFVVNAAIIGSATNVLSQMDTTAVAQKEQLDAVADYLRYRRVPLRVLNKILSYYSYLWEIGQSSHSEQLFQELPDKVKLELCVTLNKKLIQNVPIFKALSPSGVIMVVKRLKCVIMLPFELIIKEGERADSMFFLNRGTVQCFVHDEFGQKVVLTTMRDGSFFGEVALLASESGMRRTANVKAFSFCECQLLMLSDFKAVLRAFPDFQLAVHKIAAVRQDMGKHLRLQHSRSHSGKLRIKDGTDVKQRLKKIVNANMFVKPLHASEEHLEEDDEKEEGNDLYQAILENQKQMTRMAAEDAMQKEQINEQDFIQFERAVNAKYDKQVKRFQKKRESVVTLSATAFVDLKEKANIRKSTSSPQPSEPKPETDTDSSDGNLTSRPEEIKRMDSIEEEMNKMLSEIKLSDKPKKKDNK